MSKNNSQVITCKAAVAWGLREPLKIEDIQVDPPQKSEVRIKMLCSSLCQTDIHYLKKYSVVPFPQVLGHEGVGIVESIGEGVTELKEGDLVIPTYIGECGECRSCISDKTNLCMKYHMQMNGLMVDDTSRMSCKGEKLHHMFSSATWAEYTVVNINYAVKIDSSLALEHASLMSCGFSTGFGAAWKEAKVQKGSTVVVFGLGAVGLGALEGARTMGASRIIGVDLNELKKEKGEIFGMTDFVNPAKMNKPTVEIIKEMTGGLGADYSFECTGVGPLINQALDCVAMGTGVTILIGVPPEPNTSISIMALILGRTLKGTIFGGIKPQTDLPFILEKGANKEINFDALITHKVKLEDINHVINEVATRPDCLKVIIEMNTH